MLLGDPYRFAFLIERIPEWEKTGWKNGIMFVITEQPHGKLLILWK